ncbi:MAG: type II toxin-antitoxin system VapC family toxin [Acidobacteria bacterium]|nr:type II toxin-antitoxin system VapC family toxin [Acidobacteriota bacterium]
MKALDTNVLVRFLVNDDRAQAERVRRLLAGAEEEGESFLITLPVVMELIWVLRSVYGLDKAAILEALDALTLMPVLEFEQVDRVRELIRLGLKTRLELVDLLICICGRLSGAESTLTFDRKAGQEAGFTLI